MKRKSFLSLFLVLFSLASLFASDSEIALQQLLLQNNLELKQARADFELAKLDLKDAKAGYSPQLDLDVSATYLANPLGPIAFKTQDILNQLTAQGYDVSPFAPYGNSYVTVYEGMKPMFYRFSLSLTQPIWTWGKLHDSVSLSEAVLSLRQDQLMAKQKELVSTFKGNVASLYFLGKMEQNLQKQEVLAQRLVTLSEQAFNQGLLLEQEVLEVKVQRKQLSLALLRLSHQKAEILQNVSTLCNTPSLEEDQFAWEFDPDGLLSRLEYDLQALQAKAVSNQRETIRMLDKMVEVSQYASQIAGSNIYWKPDIALQVTAGYGGSSFPLFEHGWEDADDYAFNVTVALKTTIWDGGKKLNAIARANQKEQQASFDKEQSMLEIIGQVEEHYLTMELSAQTLTYLEMKQKSAQQKTEQDSQLFTSGYGSEADLVKSQLAELSLDLEVQQQWLTYIGSYYTIGFLSGLDSNLL